MLCSPPLFAATLFPCWLSPSLVLPVLTTVLIAAALQALARLLARCLRLPEHAGVALVLAAAALGAGLGAWAGTLSSSGP